MKEKGILLPVFSLPSQYGIGDFGNEAYEFVDILSANNITYWEILPINACRNFPYSPTSYYALNEDYISLDKLKEAGLLDEVEKREVTNKAVYDKFKRPYFKEAFSRFRKNDDYEAFIKQKEIVEYAEYMSENKKESADYFLFLQYIAYSQWMALKK